MPLASLTTGIIAVGYMAHDGEFSLERAAAILTAVVAAWILFRRAAYRYWRQAHSESPDTEFPLYR